MAITANDTPAPAATTKQAKVQKNQRQASRTDKFIALLRRPQGATLETLMKSSGWQAHSVRGFLSGTLKKKLGRTVVSQKTDKGRLYRLPKEDVQ